MALGANSFHSQLLPPGTIFPEPRDQMEIHGPPPPTD